MLLVLYVTKENRVGNLLICSLPNPSFAQITQIKWVTLRDLLRSLRINERLWANRSGCSWQKRDCERIAQVTHDKRATVSDSLRSLMIKERMSKSLIHSFAHKKRAICSKKLTKSYFFVRFFVSFFLKTSHLLIPSFLKSDVSESLRLLTKNVRCERIAQDAHQKWARVSNSLGSLTINERGWANSSGCSPKMSDLLRIPNPERK